MIEFKLPSLGADMDDGTLLEWKVGVGDTVTKGQVIAVVDTAKAAVDVECWTPGTVHELVAEVGQKMPVGTVMAILSESGEKVGAGGTAECRPVTNMGTAAVSPAAPTARRMISPAARKHAEERGVDLDAVVGSGPNGAVTLDDVENAAAQPAPVTAPKPAATPDKSAEMRKAIAAAMARSKREIPHYYVAEDIPLAKALAWLQAENAAAADGRAPAAGGSAAQGGGCRACSLSRAQRLFP